jgi:hypothetical protein
VRWLVAEVPQRVEIVAGPPRAEGEDANGSFVVTVRVRDKSYAPLDNAAVAVRVTGPDGKSVELTAEPGAAGKSGEYETTYVARRSGAYRALVTATAPDGSLVGEAQAGWTSDPAADEFQTLRANRELLSRLAGATGGEVTKASDLGDLVASLPTRSAQITEPFIQPLWHQSWVFLLAIVCLSAEWGLRRWRGLP